jgi:dipeptidyl aminopeptidase/acylaminoacyl peptidase
MVSRLVAAGLFLLPSWIGAAHATPPACRERLLPPSPGAATGQRPITPRDLIELRDFGRIDDGSWSRSFRVSPNGKWAALILRRADPDADDYCFGVVLVGLDGITPPRLLDVGGEFIPAMTDPYGASGVPSGVPVTDAPVWSPDSRTLAFLRRDHGRTQIWVVGLDGAPARPVSNLATEPSNLAWSADGKALLFSVRKGQKDAEAAIEQEARRGFLYDERLWSVAFARPHPLPLPFETQALDLAGGEVRVVSDEAAEALRGRSPISKPAGARLFAGIAGGSRAWTALADPARPRGPTVLNVEAGGKRVACAHDVCREPIAGLWWIDPRTLVILRGGSPANGGRNILFVWKPGAGGSPVRLLETEDWLPGCEPQGGALICAREGATQPRTLERVDLETGHGSLVFDPNPEIRRLRFGEVTRLRWTDRDGTATYGDLVLPPDHKPGQRHPLIIVQYFSRGFMRGGLGDEYPMQVFAQHGYAVLSFQAPSEPAAAAAQQDDVAAQRVKVKDWSGRRYIFHALDAGIDAAVAKGVVDPEMIGITGMSDGASTVQFALNNSTRFKAAAISNCCDEPSTVFSIGMAYGSTVVSVGYPIAGEDGRDFWQAQSLTRNAARMRVPLLMHLSDGEFRLAQEPYIALKAHRAPVEMYVFADEWHTKWHPAHRLAIYERNLAWFDFWLGGIRSAGSDRAADIERWSRLRLGP